MFLLQLSTPEQCAFWGIVVVQVFSTIRSYIVSRRISRIEAEVMSPSVKAHHRK